MEPARILVVDDEAAILRLLKEALTQWGYQVTGATSAAEALQALRGDMFDAVITDIRMPDMNGLELLKEIKRHDESVEVVVMTGYPTIASAVEALKEGAFDYLSKPLLLDEQRDPRGPPGVRILRSRPWRLLGRRLRHARAVPRRQRGDDLPRRGRRAFAGTSSKAPACPPGDAGAPRRLDQGVRGRRARDRGDEPRPRADDRGGPAAPGPVLSPQRGACDPASARLASRRHSAAREPLHPPLQSPLPP